METQQQLMQDNDPCGCDKALVAGIFSYRYVRGDKSAEKYVHNFLATASKDEFKKAMEAGGGFSFEGIGFDANMNDDEFRTHQDQFKSENTDWNLTVDNNTLIEKFGDKNVLDAWTKCKLGCKNDGLFETLEVKDDGIIHFKLMYINNSGHPSLNVERCEIRNGYKFGTAQVYLNFKPLNNGDPQDFYIKRIDNNAAVTIELTADNKIRSFYIPQYIAPLPPPPKTNVYYELIFNDINQNGKFSMLGINGNSLLDKLKANNFKEEGFSSYLKNGENSLNAWILGTSGNINAEITITKYFKVGGIIKSKPRHLQVNGAWRCDLSSSHAPYCNAHIEPDGTALEVGTISSHTINFTINSNENIVDSIDYL